MNEFVLANRGVIMVSGVDSASFLQGLITNDIKKASEDTLIYTMMLSPQGRFVTDFFIQKIEDGFLLDTPKSFLQDILRRLTSYKLRSKVEIADVSDKFDVVASFIKLDNTYIQDPRDKAMGYRSLSHDLSIKDCSNMDDYEKHRIQLKIPDAEKDFILERSFPLEYGAIELNAIDFQKGCYVGQEVTARTHHLGTIRKVLMNLEIEQNEIQPAKGAEITSDGKRIGIVLGINNHVGLALVYKEEYDKCISKAFLADNVNIKLF